MAKLAPLTAKLAPLLARLEPVRAKIAADKKLKFGAIGLGVLLILCPVIFIVLKPKAPPPPPPRPAPRKPVPQKPAQAEAGVKLDIEKTVVAEQPAQGSVNGRKFSLSGAVYDTGKGILTLRAGTSDAPDLELQLHLPVLAGTVPEQKSYKKSLMDEDGKPHAFTFWKLDGKGMGKGTHQKGFQLKLDFKPISGKTLPGGLVFAVEGEEKSELNGTFAASIVSPPAAPIQAVEEKKPALPEIVPAKLEKYCGNEIGILCNDKRSTPWRSVQCLKEHRGSLLKKCKGYLRYIGRLD